MCRKLVIGLVVVLAGIAVARADEPSGKDEGYPLPEGAILRIGSVRWRHSDTVTALACSRDGKHLVTGCADKKVRLWDAATGKLIHEMAGHTGEVRAVAISPDGDKIVSGGLDKQLRVWATATGKEIDKFEFEEGIECLAVSPDGKFVASGDRDWAIRLTRIDNGHESTYLGKHKSTVTGLVFAADSNTLISCGADKCVYFWGVAKEEEIRHFSGHDDAILSIALSPDGEKLATGSKDGTARVWNLAGKEIDKLGGDMGAVWSVAFSSDGKWLATAADGDDPATRSVTRPKTVRIWDVASGKESKPCAGHALRLKRRLPHSDFTTTYLGAACVAFVPGTTKLASGGGDGRVRFWDPKTGAEVTEPGGASTILSMTLAPDGKHIAVAGDDGKVRLMATDTGKEVRVLVTVEQDAPVMAFSPDGSLLAVGGKDRIIRIVQVADGKQVATCKGHEAGITALRFSPDGKALLSAAGSDLSFRLWDPAQGKELHKGTLNDPVTAIGFTPDGKWVAIGSANCTVRLWDRETFKEGRTIADQHYPVTRVSFSIDGQTLATTGEEDNKARLWDVATAKEILECAGHEDDVEDVVFAPRGHTLFTASRDGTIRLWERATGVERGVLHGHLGEVNSLVLSRDGSMLASRSRDGTVIIWDAIGAHAGVKPTKLDPDALDKLWADLGSNDGAAAYKAVKTIVACREQAAPFVRERLKPVSGEIRARIKKLIADLDSDDFQTREKATDELGAIGPLAAEPLREALKNSNSLEFKLRAERLLEKIDTPGLSKEQQRLLRAVEALELIGDKAAREHLKSLADGMPEAELTKQAKAALARLAAND